MFDKLFDVITKQAKVVPHILIAFFIFALIFPNTSRTLIHTMLNSTYTLFPNEFINAVRNLFIPIEKSILIFSTLTILFLLSLIWELLEKYMKGESEIELGYTASIFFYPSSIGFLLFLIADKAQYTSYSVHDIQKLLPLVLESSLHYHIFQLSFVVFIAIFSIAYLSVLWYIPIKIKYDFEGGFKRKIVTFVIYSIELIILLNIIGIK